MIDKLETGHIYIKGGHLVEEPTRYASREWWDSLTDLGAGTFTGEIIVGDYSGKRVNVVVKGHPKLEEFNAVLLFKEFHKMVTSDNYEKGVYRGRITPTAKGTVKGIRILD